MARRSQASLSLFKNSDAEGYLEKISSGITSRLMGKTRVWCELYGISFYIFRETKRSSSEANMIDMKTVQMVRKVASDKTGTHFEVVSKNKSTSFCAASVEECEKWIKTLQHAMTLKDQEHTDSLCEDVSGMTSSDYELIDVFPSECPPQVQPRQSTTSESGYAEIGFHNLPADPKKNPALAAKTTVSASGEQAMQEIPEEQPSAVKQDDYGYTQVGSSLQELTQKKSQEQPTDPTQQRDDYGYTQVQVRKKSFQEDVAPVVSPTEGRTEAEGEEDSYGYAKVQARAPAAATSSESQASATDNGCNPEEDGPRSPGDGADSGDDLCDDDEDEDELYKEATSRPDPDPVPELPHPLTQDDTVPLRTVLEFLSQNSKVCRRSYCDKKLTDDPVTSMKKLLQEISG